MTEQAFGPSGSGTVLLELGPGVGALVLQTPAELDGAEIEISRPGGGRTHSCVRPRHTPAGTSYAAVYPELTVGEYAVLLGETPVLSVRVTGGSVTTARLRSRPPAPTRRSADAGTVRDGEGQRQRDAAHHHDRDGDREQPLRLGGAGG